MLSNQGPLVIRHLIFGTRAPASAAAAVPIRPLALLLASFWAYRIFGGMAWWNGEQTAW